MAKHQLTPEEEERLRIRIRAYLETPEMQQRLDELFSREAER